MNYGDLCLQQTDDACFTPIRAVGEALMVSRRLPQILLGPTWASCGWNQNKTPTKDCLTHPQYNQEHRGRVRWRAVWQLFTLTCPPRRDWWSTAESLCGGAQAQMPLIGQSICCLNICISEKSEPREPPLWNAALFRRRDIIFESAQAPKLSSPWLVACKYNRRGGDEWTRIKKKSRAIRHVSVFVCDRQVLSP